MVRIRRKEMMVSLNRYTQNPKISSVFRTLGLSAVLAFAAVSGSAIAGDAAAGKEKAATCAACHGADGVSQIPTNPILAGQYASYLEQALKDYRSGARQNAIMAGFATQLSDEDIADLAAWFSSQPGPMQTAPIK